MSETEGILSNKQVDKAKRVVEVVVGFALTLFRDQLADEKWKDRFGGACCLADNRGRTRAVFFVGDIAAMPKGKAPKYSVLCQEKAERLGAYLVHLSPWQSRSPSNDRWGGAVRLFHRIWSFSGLPELGDEAVMLMAAIILAEDSLAERSIMAEARYIAQVSRNHYFEELLNHRGEIEELLEAA